MPYVCSDELFRAAASAIKASLFNYDVIYKPPREGKDYNELLQKMKGIKREKRGEQMNDEKMIKVILVKPQKKPQLIEISGEIDSMQRIVGGSIEMVMPFDDDAALICNEEGKLLSLPLNRAIYSSDGSLDDIIAGDFFICKAPSDSEYFESLTDSQIKRYMDKFKYPEKIMMTEQGIMIQKCQLQKQEYAR